MTNKKILVVDDEPHLIRSLTFILAREGYEIATASNGEEALLKIGESLPDLIFLDIMMPKKNGYEVCEAIRNVLGLKNIYIIMLSAKGWDIDRSRALMVGANEFMSKPFSPLDVISRVRKALNPEMVGVGSEPVNNPAY
ncbi:MAG TPA: response regulator [Dehalococcoidales bacterium]|nr:response regulator [Dehalococcoidales bacterium]